jgi:hypothetical protein
MYPRYRAWIAAAIAEGVAAGEFAEVDPEATADLAMALIDGLGLRVLPAAHVAVPADGRTGLGLREG